MKHNHSIEDHHLIYRVSADFTVNGQQNIFSNAPRPMGETLVAEFPGILSSTKVMGYNGLEIHSGHLWYNQDQLLSEHVFAVDSNFLEVFGTELIQGNTNALDNPNCVVLSKSIAKSLFGNQDPMGKTIKLESQEEVVVTGVFADHEGLMHLPYEVLISYTTFFPNRDSEIWWYGGHVYTYLKVDKSFRIENIELKWQSFFEKYMSTTFEELNGQAKIILQPIASIHLSPEFIWEPYSHGSRDNIEILKIIGIFLLLVACFNYANLALSQSVHRQQEISIRKILGSTNMLLARQHLMTSMMTSLFAGILSVSLLIALVPFFNDITDGIIAINFLQEPQLLLAILTISIGCGIISGIYPAIFEASLGTLLKSEDRRGKNQNLKIRRILVIGQQVISVALIVFTLIVIDQINYVKNADIGFNKDGLMLIEMNDREMREKADLVKNKLLGLQGIVAVSIVEETPRNGPNEFSYHIRNSEGDYVINSSQTITVGDDFVPTMQLDLLAGRFFKKDDHEYHGLIINAYLAKQP